MSGPVIYDFSPSNLPPDLLQAIGLTIACAAQTEDILNAAIGGCLGIDAEYNMAVTTHMSVPLKFSVLYSAAEIRIDDLDALDELDEILDAVDKALRARNTVAHNLFAVHPVTGKAHRIHHDARISVQVELTPVDITAIVGEAQTILEAGLNLGTFLQMHGLYPALPAGRPRAHKSRAARKARRKKSGK